MDAVHLFASDRRDEVEVPRRTYPGGQGMSAALDVFAAILTGALFAAALLLIVSA